MGPENLQQKMKDESDLRKEWIVYCRLCWGRGGRLRLLDPGPKFCKNEPEFYVVISKQPLIGERMIWPVCKAHAGFNVV